MKFEVGKCYWHQAGRGMSMKILGYLDTTLWGKNALIAETDDNRLIAIGKEESAAVNWHEITEYQWMLNFSI